MSSVFGKEIMDLIEDFLTMMNLNNDFGRLLIATIIISVFVVILALIKANALVIIFAVILFYVLFVEIGFIPAWTLIASGGLGVLFIFLKLKGGGTSSDE